MSEIAIQVENLTKRYRIGKLQNGQPKSRSLVQRAADPFRYLVTTLRPPSEAETLWALNGVSFDVQRGNVLGIIGRNGAGKSTLLKLLSRITEPTSGRAIIHGRVGALLEVGTGFHPELTGRENIFLSGAILGMRRAEIAQKFDEIVTFSGVERFIDTPIKYYSSGMRVRLGFAVAAHLEPEVLLIDEVLAVGDAEFQKKCLGKMSEVANQGRTVLFVSHNMAAVQSLCTHGIYMQNGKVLVNGSIRDAVEIYLRQLEERTQEDLALRVDRTGQGEIRLNSVEIWTQTDPPSSTLITGQPARFEFYLNRPVKSVRFEYLDFTIYDSQGRPVVYFNSSEQSGLDRLDEGMGARLVCEVDDLLLLPGRYRLNVGLKANGDQQDHVEGAAFFNVEEGAIQGRAVDQARSRRPGSVYFLHRWVRPASE
ncbi:ABC-type polysaccharide/polyol phosphate transport system, ATPase component [Longilinea arvoryzae]|uniref:ABC-type polysaccharide/polyol phosphate transport system, ATPase component n=1 Tax=Longilinea arvoryzae TaxID=360412 RepID=A0A0S7BG45_9CHLR|nr:ABC transporter ATP-binding protein [Longilinea arvoryzae]GAP13462.1 ABC-type polysaccharide/polyol phosphate transport system, ATPase component [Longilinea arvoryzae]